MNIENFKFHSVIPILHTPLNAEDFFEAYARIKLCDKNKGRTLIIMTQIANKKAETWEDINLKRDTRVLKNAPHTLLREYVEGKNIKEREYKLKNNKNDEAKWDDKLWKEIEKKLKSIDYLEKIKNAVESELDESLKFSKKSKRKMQ